MAILGFRVTRLLVACHLILCASAQSSSSTSSTTPTTTSSSAASGTVIVDAAGNGQFTAISPAISYAQTYAQPTVVVKAGVYNEAVTVVGSAAVSIVGETTDASDYTKNQVTISSTTLPLSINSNSVKGITWRNINFINTATGNAPTVSLRGTKNAFYGCQFISSGATAISSTLGITFISNSYIEGTDKLLYGYLGLYIFKSTIAATASSATIVYSRGYSTPVQYSQTVLDSCKIIQKPGTTNTYVYLAGPNGDGAQAVFKYTSMASLIAPGGTRAVGTNGFFGEYATTGPGSYGSNTNRVDTLMTESMLSNSTIEYVFANSFVGYSTTSTSWIDSSVLQDISAANAIIATTSSSSSSSSSTSFSTSLSSSVSTTSSSSSSITSSPVSSSSSTTSTVSSSTTSASRPSNTLVVSLQPNSTEYGSISAAVSALPNDGFEKTIIIKPGTYTEQVNIQRTGKVILRGITEYVNDYSQNQVTVQFNYGVSTSAGQNELTPVIYSKKNDGSGLALYNINFINTFPQTRNYAALAADFYGANMAAYGCSFIGFQDTLLANKGTQVFSNCYVEGSVDFVWGFSSAYFHRCTLAANTPGTSIAAQSRSSASVAGGYVFDQCYVTYTSTYGSSFGLTYLARPYSNFSVVVYKNSYLDKNINLAGWSVWQTNNPQTSNVLFGEYNNVGPSQWTSSTSRASFATQLTDAQAAAYELGTFLGSTSWIDMDTYNLVPSITFTSSGVSNNGTIISPTTTSATSTATATETPTPSANSTSGHPSSGTVPPTGAVLVSVDGSISGSFANLTAAIASLPKDSTPQTVFIYPGSYTEQVSINRAGPVTVIGSQPGDAGKTYTGNQVTITFARGLSVVPPVPAGSTNAQTAVISTASNTISFYNINFINTDNSDGSKASYVTLAASVYGDKIGFYGCSFVGWQDTLLTGNPSGYAYYESSYIEGAIDYVWGYSLSYFKGCTLASKKAKSCITAQSRASTTATGGYIFDQCLFTSASGYETALEKSVYLGRPYSQYAKVVIKYSYLDSSIQPAGWKAWSTSDPRLDAVTFVEYQNTGPGNWENNAAARIAFGNATLATSDSYALEDLIRSSSWIDRTYWDSIVTPQPAVVVPVDTAGNSTTPASGACIVSKTSITGQTTYQTVAECINNLPSGNAVATIFIYPGTYNEQLTFNRTGPTVIRGYASSPDNFSQNEVIITNSNGVDTQGDQSNSDSATFYSRGKNVKFYNINLINKFGTAKDYASLAFSVGNNGYASFYGCQIIGNQDTLNINVGASVFAYNSYVEGSIDFIWGSGSAYFLASTIAPNTPGISITADKRATNTSIGGIVFDACKVTPSTAGAALSGMAGSVYLGRPWNANAKVAYIRTYLDSCVNPAGWTQWSKSTPNTDGVFFGEYQNTGPGAAGSRAAFSRELSSAEVAEFQLTSFFSLTSWIDFNALSVTPFTPSDIVTTSTVTLTVSPTGSIPVVTSSSTVYEILTSSLALSTVTKNETQKISSVFTTTASDVLRQSTLKVTTTSFSTISPDPKLITSTIDGVVRSTTTIQGSPFTTIVSETSKVTGYTTISVAPVTVLRVSTLVEVQIQTITPKAVSETVTSLEIESRTSTITPKAKTVDFKSTTTLVIETTAPTPQVTITEISSTVATELRTSTPKGVTKTTVFQTIIPAGPTVTVAAKKAVTSKVLFTSTVLKTKKVTTTLSCIPAASLVPRGRFEAGLIRARQAGSSTSSIPVVTVYYTIPQSTSTKLELFSATSTTTIVAQKVTQTNTYTSFNIKTTVIPGQTITSIVETTIVVPKTLTLPVATSTILTTLEGTSISTVSLKGQTLTSSVVVLRTVKTITATLPIETVEQTSTKTEFSVQRTTLDAVTYLTTASLTSTKLDILTLPTPTITSSKISTVTLKQTFTPPGVTQRVTIVRSQIVTSVVTLQPATVWISSTSTSREPTPTVTSTRTVTASETVKVQSTVTSTVNKTAKNAPTCAS